MLACCQQPLLQCIAVAAGGETAAGASLYMCTVVGTPAVREFTLGLGVQSNMHNVCKEPDSEPAGAQQIQSAHQAYLCEAKTCIGLLQSVLRMPTAPAAAVWVGKRDACCACQLERSTKCFYRCPSCFACRCECKLGV